MDSLLLSSLTSLLGGTRLEQAGHILDGQDVGALALHFAGQVNIIFEAVFRAGRIEDITGVADGCLDNLAGIVHGLDAFFHLGQPVQAVEYAEYIDAIGRGQLDKFADHIVRIG